MRYIFVIVWLASGITLFGQDPHKVDSLKSLLHETPAKHDTIIADAYLQLAQEFYQKNWDSVTYYAQKCLAPSKRAQYPYGITQSYLYQSLPSFFAGEYSTYLSILNQGIDEIEAFDYGKGEIFLNTRIAVAYKNLGKKDSALIIFKKGLERSLELNYDNGIINNYLNLGNLNYRDSQFDEAMYYYLKGDSVCRYKTEAYSSCAGIELGLGNVTFQNSDYDKAIAYFKKSLAIYDSLDNPYNIAHTQYLIGKAFKRKTQYDSALYFLLKAYDFTTSNNYQKVLRAVDAELGDVYLAKEDYQKALRYYHEELSVSLKLEGEEDSSAPYTNLGKAYFKTNLFDSAIYYLNRALVIAKDEKNIFEQERSLKFLSLAYSRRGDINLALDTYEEYINVNDSLQKVKNLERSEALEVKYKAAEKQQQIELLRTQNELAKEQRQKELYVTIAIALIGFSVAAFFFILYRNRQKTAKKLQELDIIKSNFFTNISHEFRTPLTLIKVPVEERLTRSDLSKKELDQMQMIKRNADRLLSLVDQLLDLSKLESKSMTLMLKQASLAKFLKVLTSSFIYATEQKNIAYKTDIALDSDESWFDQDVMEKIVINLLSNAVKYTPEQGQILFNASLTGEYLKISIKNTGEGFNDHDISNIFNRFYQSDNASDGVGIGLALVKELTSLHKGQVILNNDDKGWVEFVIQIPVSKKIYASYKQVSYISDAESESSSLPVYTEQESTDVDKEAGVIKSEKPILLIIEDNADLRSLIRDLFSDTYEILEANNGDEGINQAIESIPDIIISDIIMPVKDGVELSKTLKTDERTSHIPIILLTAKTGDDNELQGLETGADEYMAKPFNPEILKVRVKKLIELRAQLRQRYSQEVVLRPKDIAISSTDEKFLVRVQELMDNKLTESSFTAEAFSHEIGMSRMQLHRKLKALTGLTTTEFIRAQRLQMAAHLLETTEVNMSEVGYTVGFNDPSYFAKCFKEMYNCTPKQYAANTK